MIPVFFALLLFISPLRDGECDRMYQRIDAPSDWDEASVLRDSLKGDQRSAFKAQLQLLTDVRDCYGASRPHRVYKTYNYQVYSHIALGDRSSAIASIQSFLTWAETMPPDTPDSTQSEVRDQVAYLSWIRAYLYYQQGDLAGAIGAYADALEATPDSNVERRTNILTDLGVLSGRVKDFRAARYYYTQANSLLTSIADEQERIQDRSRILFALADLIASQNPEEAEEIDQALSYLQQSMSVWSEPGTERHALQHSLLAELQAKLGNLETAYRANDVALRYARQSGEVHREVLFLFKRSFIDVYARDYASAERNLEAGLRLVTDLESLNLRRRLLYQRGRVAEYQGHLSEAESYYRRAIEVVETQRLSLRATQWASAAFASWQTIYRSLVRVLLSQGKQADAFLMLEQTRARNLQDLRLQTRVSRELPESQQATFDSLSTQLADVRSRLSAVESSEEEAQLRIDELRLRSERRQLIVLDTETDSLSVAELQAHLKQNGQVLVSYFIDDPSPFEQRPSQSSAFVVTPDTLLVRSLPDVTRDTLRRQVEAVSPLFTSRGKSSSIESVYFDLDRLHKIYGSAFAPVQDVIPEQTPLVIVPDGSLFNIPFSMFVTEAPPSRFAYREASFLLAQHPITLELSASLAVQPDSSEMGAVDVAAFGVSRFSQELSIPTTVRASIAATTDRPVTRGAMSLPDLPGVETELAEIRRLFDDAQVALNQDATEDAFHRYESRASVIHLASHAFVHPTTPMFNAFLLSSGNSPGTEDDGFLFLHELRRDKGPIPLVVLSGCSTARGALRSGEGMEGLQYGFRASGAMATVSNLWPADDRVAVELTRSFYRYLQHGLSKDVALQKAKLDFLNNHPDLAAPFFWAPTVLYGSNRPLALKEPPAWYYLTSRPLAAVGVLLGLLFLMGVAFEWVRRRPTPARA